MSQDPPRTITLVTREEDDLSRSGIQDLVDKAVDVSVLRDRFKDFIAGLHTIIDVSEANSGPFHLAEVHFTAEIMANGEFKLLGTGIGAEAHSGIEFVLQRKAGNP